MSIQPNIMSMLALYLKNFKDATITVILIDNNVITISSKISGISILQS
jgi:hypothetical protein